MTDLTTILRRARPYVSGQYNGLTHPEALEVLDLIDRALIAAQHPSQSAGEPVADERTRAALAELVAVKDLKERTEALYFAGPTSEHGEGWKDVYEAQRKEYLRRQPAAWAAATAALASPPPTDAARASGEAPIDMVLHCPACGMQHVDAPEVEARCQCVACGGRQQGWTNPPHRSHLCHGCGHIWRPADVPTNGVAAVKTKGKADSPIATPTEPDAARVEADRREAKLGRVAMRFVDRAGDPVSGIDDAGTILREFHEAMTAALAAERKEQA